MNADIIRETERLWTEQPDKAQATPTVTARSDGSQATMEAAAFTVRADLPPALGGGNQAPSPTLLLLSALAGCAVVFVRDTLAPQLGVPVEAVEATARCATDARGLLGMAGALPDLQDIQLDLRVRSSAPEAALQQLFRAWEERCPIYLALTKGTPVALTTGTISGA